MSIEVLISCMHQSDWSIIQRSNIQTDVLIINQCDQDTTERCTFINYRGTECQARMIRTTQRGLSKSRNMALQNAQGDICIFCDDDEYFETNYSETILSAFQTYANYAIIAFRLNYERKNFPNKVCYYNRFTSGRLSSAQIAFRRVPILQKNILFDIKLGSGTGNGGGEENKWLYQLLSKSDIKAIYTPTLIASIQSSNSMWFHGYNQTFFINYGWTSRQIYGWFLGALYIIYHVLTHCKLYSPQHTIIKIIQYMFIGYMQKR